MRWQISEDHPLRRMFHGLVEQVFETDLGICNPRLADYVGDILVEFVHVDRIYRAHGVDGSAIRDLSRIEARSLLGDSAPDSEHRRLMNQYIGDFTLFWAGVYPEALRPRHAGVDCLAAYLKRGKRSYEIASELSDDRSKPPPALLRELSQEFEACVHGLHLVRENWQRVLP